MVNNGKNLVNVFCERPPYACVFHLSKQCRYDYNITGISSMYVARTSTRHVMMPHIKVGDLFNFIAKVF